MKKLLSLGFLLCFIYSCTPSTKIVKLTESAITGFSKEHISELNLLESSEIKGKEYFISNSGNDSNNGLSTNNAFKTIAKIKTINLKPGDKIFFERGGVWREQFDIHFSGSPNLPIIIGSYGKGAKPIITGSEIVKDWLHVGSNIWVTNANNLEIPWWTVVVAKNKLFTPVYGMDELTTDYKFFIESGSRKLYIFSSQNPNNLNIERTIRQHCINVNGKNNIVIENIQLQHAGHYGIMFRGFQKNGNCIVRDCILKRNFYGGILFMENHSKNIVTRCRAEENGNGFYAVNSDYNVFSHDTMVNTIAYSPQGFMSDGHGIGLFRSKDCIVENCFGDQNEGGAVGFDPDADNFAGPNGGIIRNNFFKNGMNSSACIGIQEVAPNSELLVYNNLLINDDYNGPKGFALYSGFEIQGKLLVFNNTIIQKKRSYRAVAFRYGDNVYFFNNVIYNEQSEGSALEIAYGGRIYSDYNLFYSPNSATLINYKGQYFNNLSSWTISKLQDKQSFYDKLSYNPNNEMIKFNRDKYKYLRFKNITEKELNASIGGIGYSK